ncbi:hypothetical protein ETB97_005191 [Aspergillus alliaceus]|uniref:NADP-dependent oxidoreductase domain-containing protein n=1 Tax=Petromyces alliaceus TaxID=209559 RepID=A0A8H5ZZ23_PETAA|nr:hypothetical protein ETB97_005191 [Aspergillus burnettii]
MAITTESKTELKVVLGTMTLSKEAHVHDPNGCATMLDAFQKHGYNEIDSARVPHRFGPPKPGKRFYTHKNDDLKPGLLESLQALQGEKIDLWYLHARDHNTSYAEALEVSGKSPKSANFTSAAVGKSQTSIRAAITRSSAPSSQSSSPASESTGSPFTHPAPSPVDVLTDKYQRDTGEHEDGSQFDPKKMQGANFRRRYWNEAYFSALDVIRPVAHKHGITTAEAAVRWANYHSSMKKEYSDAVITGASSAVQLEENLTNLEKGPLPQELVKEFDEGWAIVTGVCGPYFQWLSGLRIKFKILIDCLL